MTIACIYSAYVQTETLNFTLPGKPLYVGLFQRRTPNANVLADYFKFLRTPTSTANFTVSLKANKTIYCPYGNTSQTTAWPVHTHPHNYATKSPLVAMVRPKFIPKQPFPSTISTPIQYTHPSTDSTRYHKWTSGSNKPFCHSTPSGQTDRQTDRQMG